MKELLTVIREPRSSKCFSDHFIFYFHIFVCVFVLCLKNFHSNIHLCVFMYFTYPLWLGSLNDLFTYVLTEELWAKWLNQYADVLNDCSFARISTCCGWRVRTKLGRSVAHGSTSRLITSNSTLFCKIILFPKYLQFIIKYLAVLYFVCIWQYCPPFSLFAETLSLFTWTFGE